MRTAQRCANRRRAQARGRRHLFGSVGISAGQSIRLAVVNTLPPSPILPPGPILPPSPIRVRLVLLGSDGSTIASERTTLAAGHTASFEFDFDRLGQASRRFVEGVPIPGERVVGHFVLLCEGGSKMERRQTEPLLEDGVCHRPPTGPAGQ